MTRYQFFNYEGCFWKRYVEATSIELAEKKYSKCIKCDGENFKCEMFRNCNGLEPLLEDLYEMMGDGK
jgi:hypothetical protein